MRFRFCIALAICTWATSAAYSQVVRFETSVGDFDIVLNPTKNPLLQGHVDNILHYVQENSYRGSWINRAAEDFVLQMGGFYSHTKRPPATIESTRSVLAADPVIGAPGIEGLSNTAGTVSMALPGGAGGTNRDGGTSSFFVNLGDNTFLDTDFTVFAAIPDMTVVNQIMALSQIDRTDDPDFGADEGNLAFSDVPLLDNGQQVFIKKAFVITDTLTIARDTAAVQSVMNNSAASFGTESAGDFSAASDLNSTSPLNLSPGGSGGSAIVPEPGTFAIAWVAILAGAPLLFRRHRAA